MLLVYFNIINLVLLSLVDMFTPIVSCVEMVVTWTWLANLVLLRL